MQLDEILPKLKEWFPPDQHKERKVPGGKTWWFIEHTHVVDRLNSICPNDWQEDYELSHREAGGEPIYLCKLTICGVTRVGIGDKSNETSTYGTPAQRAFRKAFMDAAEKFGIAAYLDDQKDDRTKRNFINYMAKAGNVKPAMEYKKQNGQAEPPKRVDPPSKPFGQPAPTVYTAADGGVLVSDAQRKRLWTIAKSAGYTEGGIKQLIAVFGFTSSKEITRNAYDAIVDKANDREYAEMYNGVAEKLEMNIALANGAAQIP